MSLVRKNRQRGRIRRGLSIARRWHNRDRFRRSAGSTDDLFASQLEPPKSQRHQDEDDDNWSQDDQLDRQTAILRVAAR